MRLISTSTAVFTTCLIACSLGLLAQPPAGGPPAGPGGPGGGGRGRGRMIGGPGSPTADGSRAVTDGGVKASGWSGKVDANEEKACMSISDAKFEENGGAIHVTTGPASSYWKTNDKATGEFTVKASDTEPQ